MAEIRWSTAVGLRQEALEAAGDFTRAGHGFALAFGLRGRRAA